MPWNTWIGVPQPHGNAFYRYLKRQGAYLTYVENVGQISIAEWEDRPMTRSEMDNALYRLEHTLRRHSPERILVNAYFWSALFRYLGPVGEPVTLFGVPVESTRSLSAYPYKLVWDRR